MLAELLTGLGAQRDLDEFRHAVRSELGLAARAVDLDRFFADPQPNRDLLVGQAFHDELHHLQLARGQLCDSGKRFISFVLFPARAVILLYGIVDAIQQALFVIGLFNEVEGAVLH